jgi:hypothetical protein
VPYISGAAQHDAFDPTGCEEPLEMLA